MIPNNRAIAHVLLQTLTNAGYLDDANELISDMMDNESYESCIEHFVEIEHAVDFVNQFGDDCNVVNDFIVQVVDEASKRGHSTKRCLYYVAKFRQQLQNEEV
jgi:hypothetical protein